MSEFKNIKLRVEGAVADLCIDRADVLNALNRETITELLAACELVAAKGSEVRVLVLRGAGEKAFVAGADIAEMSGLTAAEAKSFAALGQKLTLAMESLGCVVLGKVQGFALGGGCELAMACDILIASENAKFSQPEVGLGLIPGFGGTQRLVRRVGLPLGLDMLVGGRVLSGMEAANLGLISRVCKAEELDAEVQKTIKKILKHAPEAVARTKHLARQAYSMELANGLNQEAKDFAMCFEGAEAKEGLNAFLQKRSANFSLR